jgi:hypothetical protein
MTDRPMDANAATEHPDEGLIHAWLDGALGAAEAERLAAHVSGCADCQARVAEARGLIAGASRIVAALDDVPAGARPGWATSDVDAPGVVTPITGGAAPPPPGSLWRWLRVTPGRAALAATILVALGITLTHERLAEDSVRSVTATFDPQKADVPAATPAERGPSEGARGPAVRDDVLDSAVARNLAQTQGRSRIEAAPGAALPQAPPPRVSLDVPTAADRDRDARVAKGRAAAEAQRETANVAADRLRVGNPTTAATAGAAEGGAGAAARRTDPAPAAAEGAMMATEAADGVAKSCLRLESPDADARWADQPFPLVIALDPGPATGPRTASVLTVAGQPTELRATWRPRGADSVSIVLRRIGYSGSIALGPELGVRSGVAVSAAAPNALAEVVAVSPSAQTRMPSAGAREEVRKDAAAPQAAPAAAAGPPVRQLRVTARAIACPR